MAIRRGSPDLPHVPAVKDPAAQRSLAEVWTRLFEMTQRVDAATAENARLRQEITSLGTSHAALQQRVRTITALGAPSTAPGAGTMGPGGGTTTPPPSDDAGQGSLGCATAGSTGHLTPGTALTLVVAGQIVCGTAQEFPALLAVEVDQPTRDANQSQLLDRMVWHMNLAGFPCSRYPTTNGRPWILLFDFQGAQYAYRVIDYAASDFSVPYTTLMVFGGRSPGVSTTPDGGTPD